MIRARSGEEIHLIGNVRHPERGLAIIIKKEDSADLDLMLEEDDARRLANTILMFLCEDYDEKYME